MLNLNAKYVVNKKGKRLAVQLGVHSYKRLIEVLEDCALALLMRETEHEERLNLHEARSFYKNL